MCILKVVWKKKPSETVQFRVKYCIFWEIIFNNTSHNISWILFIIFWKFRQWFIWRFSFSRLFWEKKSIIEKKITTPFDKNTLTAIQTTLLRHCVSCFWLANIGRECYFRLLFTTNPIGACLETISDRTLFFFFLKLKFLIPIGNWDFLAKYLVFCSLCRTYDMCSTVCSHEYSSQIHYIDYRKQLTYWICTF